jgi:phosphoglycolate phosphatase-like HAD superfamily hydrolase
MGEFANYDLVVFDLEDTLIDKGLAIADAACRGVDAYLVELLGVSKEGGPLWTRQEALDFLVHHGFTAGHDLMWALLLCALHSMPREVSEDEFGVYDGREMLMIAKEKQVFKTSLGEVKKGLRIAEFKRLLKSRQTGARALKRITGLRNQFLALAEGHILMDNFVRRVFLEAYLGDELFFREYNQHIQYCQDEPSLKLEKSYLTADELGHLRRKFFMAGVTNRSQTEIHYCLDHLNIARFFSTTVARGSTGPGVVDEDAARLTMDLGVEEAMGDADYSAKVMQAIERVRGLEDSQVVARVAYAGNCVPEERGLVGLKERYRLTLIGVVYGGDKKAFGAQKAAGADMVVSDPQSLFKVLNERPKVRPEMF